MRFDVLIGPKPWKELLTLAEEQARALGDTQIGAEHLLVATLDMQDGAARRVLRRAGTDPDAVVDAIRGAHAAALRAVGLAATDEAHLAQAPVPPGKRLDLGESAKQAIRVAAAKGKIDGVPAVSLQILDAVGDQRYGTAARALAQLGLAPGALHQAVLAELAPQAA